MRCGGCDQILWNHPAPSDGSPRACPECGRPYVVASYDFVPGKVEFQCPSCAQPYFGTTATGHLDPPAFDCVGCGTPLTEERCTLRPAGGSDLTEPMLREPLPWLEPGGRAARWWRTTRISLTQGPRLPSMLRATPQVGPALLYLAINSWIAAAAGLVFAMIWIAITSVGAGNLAIMATSSRDWIVQLLMQGLLFVVAPLFTIAVAATTACLAALPGGRFKSGFRRHLEIFSFASGSIVLGVIPVCGGFIGYVLWIVQGAQAIAAAAPRGQATGAVILAIVGFLVGVIGIGVVSAGLGYFLAF